MAWGLPPPADGADMEPAAAADGAAGAAAAVLRASEYDWDAWAGRAAEVPVALRRVADDEMTAMLQVRGLGRDGAAQNVLLGLSAAVQHTVCCWDEDLRLLLCAFGAPVLHCAERLMTRRQLCCR
jgi:hypothetical protein